jgi:hypothetical protein
MVPVGKGSSLFESLRVSLTAMVLQTGSSWLNCSDPDMSS